MSNTPRTIRSTVQPLMMGSTSSVAGDHSQRPTPFLPVNRILDQLRELYDGDTYGWAMEVLYVTQILRMAFDSPRIGGGIDPNLASGLMSLQQALEWDESAYLSYLYQETDGPYEGEGYDHAEDGYRYFESFLDDDPNDTQDMICHAEAVAVRLIDLCRLTGADY